MANPFVHVELNTTDVEKAKSFYGQMFDWKMEDMNMGPSDTYTVIKVGEGTGGGLLKNPMPGVPSSLSQASYQRGSRRPPRPPPPPP